MRQRNNRRARTLAAVLSTVAVLAGAGYAASTASADELPPIERVAELNAPYERCGIATCTVYLDRSTAKYAANRLDEAGLGGEKVTDVASGLVCTLFSKGVGVVCGVIDAVAGDSLLKAVQQAESIDGCVTLKHVRGSGILATHDIGATNSKYCRD